MKMIKAWTSFLLLVGYSQCIMGLGTALDLIDVLQRPKKCQLERIAKMIGYTCTALDLREVPQSLKTGIEVSWFQNKNEIQAIQNCTQHQLASIIQLRVSHCPFSVDDDSVDVNLIESIQRSTK